MRAGSRAFYDRHPARHAFDELRWRTLKEEYFNAEAAGNPEPRARNIFAFELEDGDEVLLRAVVDRAAMRAALAEPQPIARRPRLARGAAQQPDRRARRHRRRPRSGAVHRRRLAHGLRGGGCAGDFPHRPRGARQGAGTGDRQGAGLVGPRPAARRRLHRRGGALCAQPADGAERHRRRGAGRTAGPARRARAGARRAGWPSR